MVEATAAHRSGFASFVGRPNAGKSTLTNALVGTKIVITSDKPQTTRTVVRGIVHRPDAQLILVDTPGLHRPRTLLGERLNDLVRTTWSEVDVVAVCFPADEKVGPGDRFIVSELAKVRRTTKIAVATKTDLASPERIGQHLLDIARLGVETDTEWAEIVPVSSVSGDQVKLLEELLIALMPEGPQLYPDGDLTDAPEETLVAELIREAALDGVRDELPHSIAVLVEEMGLRPDRPAGKPLLDIHANLYVEWSSQKGHRHRPQGRPPASGRLRGPPPDRGPPRHAGLPRPAREDRQGLAARPASAAQARLLTCPTVRHHDPHLSRLVLMTHRGSGGTTGANVAPRPQAPLDLFEELVGSHPQTQDGQTQHRLVLEGDAVLAKRVVDLLTRPGVLDAVDLDDQPPLRPVDIEVVPTVPPLTHDLTVGSGSPRRLHSREKSSSPRERTPPSRSSRTV